jgi:hypothetical protein
MPQTALYTIAIQLNKWRKVYGKFLILHVDKLLHARVPANA